MILEITIKVVAALLLLLGSALVIGYVLITDARKR